ncbi:MAG: glycosyltransferase family 2 protein [Candidatus Lokiarchaeota archaeon]|nr:glycosyltransferase family 2 protein [Candidatus Lokiarchaeota archaeon]
MKKEKIYISTVIPMYKCSQCIEELYKRLITSLEKITNNYEIIFVNDGSPGNDWDIIKKISSNDIHVKGINLSRNFGQHYAITAGLDYAKGEWVVVMDCDLQDQPEEIQKLYKKAQKGYDIVFGRRVIREDGYFKRLKSKIFFKIFYFFTNIKFDHTVANFSISKQIVIENFKNLEEHNRTFPLFMKWLGFKIGYETITHSKRFSGKTSYNFSKLINIVIGSVLAYSNKPLKLSIILGFFMSIITFICGLIIIIRYFFHSIPIQGWTSIIVSIFFLAGLIFINMGILGLYMGKIFNETKHRPLYIISEKINL